MTNVVELNGPLVARLRRENKRLSQEQLARKAGYSKRTIERLEAGKPTRASTVQCVAKALGVDADILLKKNDECTTIQLPMAFDAIFDSEKAKLVSGILALLKHVESVKIVRSKPVPRDSLQIT